MEQARETDSGPEAAAGTAIETHNGTTESSDRTGEETSGEETSGEETSGEETSADETSGATTDDTGDGAGAAQAPIAPENVRLARELAAELRELRGSAARIAENYASRVDARLARLERFASRRGRNGRYLSAPPAKVLTRMLKELRRLRVREGKGRPKDLARVRRLVDELERLADRAEPPPADRSP
jgi:hypothetical protein